jgi:hypothetical protein
MKSNENVIECLKMIMKGRSLKIDYVLNLVEIVNSS